MSYPFHVLSDYTVHYIKKNVDDLQAGASLKHFVLNYQMN